MSAMLPIFYGEMPELASAPTMCRPDQPESDPDLVSRAAAEREPEIKKKRVLTEARKEQNREAQRLFRQRQRERKRQQQQQQQARKLAKQPELRPRVGNESANVSPSSTSSEENTLSNDTVNSVESSAPSDTTDDDDSAVDVPVIPHALVTAALRAAMPDPLSNNLEFLPTTVFGACLHNALALGVNLDDLASCSPEGISPFYRPSTPADDPATLFSSAMLGLTRKLPPSLLPTLTQILIPHHPSLDLLPLPHLRDQAIMLSAAMPQVFNTWELKLDIYQRGGLVMLKKRLGRDGKTRSCRPWEMSSWVAQPWFLRKWSMVVVGEREQLSKDVPSDVDSEQVVYR